MEDTDKKGMPGKLKTGHLYYSQEYTPSSSSSYLGSTHALQNKQSYVNPCSFFSQFFFFLSIIKKLYIKVEQ